MSLRFGLVGFLRSNHFRSTEAQAQKLDLFVDGDSVQPTVCSPVCSPQCAAYTDADGNISEKFSYNLFGFF